ncbi:MAG TPA: pyrroloquinoline quinone precursor peptide PqqA [Pararhizobium sp.]|jgi:coenzyme PQQ precursor peptide PqqA|nr:pyrroloquinoline quinone precursor peptide PqqA [Pararhizobium sp.]
MKWSTPKIKEYQCGMEICRYMQADDGRPPLS